MLSNDHAQWPCRRSAKEHSLCDSPCSVGTSAHRWAPSRLRSHGRARSVAPDRSVRSVEHPVTGVPLGGLRHLGAGASNDRPPADLQAEHDIRGALKTSRRVTGFSLRGAVVSAEDHDDPRPGARHPRDQASSSTIRFVAGPYTPKRVFDQGASRSSASVASGPSARSRPWRGRQPGVRTRLRPHEDKLATWSRNNGDASCTCRRVRLQTG